MTQCDFTDVITCTRIRNVFYFCNRVAVSKQVRLSLRAKMSLRGGTAYKFLAPLSSKAAWKYSNAFSMTFAVSLYQGRSKTAGGVEGEHESPSAYRTENVLVCIILQKGVDTKL